MAGLHYYPSSLGAGLCYCDLGLELAFSFATYFISSRKRLTGQLRPASNGKVLDLLENFLHNQHFLHHQRVRTRKRTASL